LLLQSFHFVFVGAGKSFEPFLQSVKKMEELEREVYYRNRAIEIQNKIVNVRCCSTSTSEALIWTYKTTSCDVLSIITTVVPSKNGYMKDIKLQQFERNRL
jgi:hypothetical protein